MQKRYTITGSIAVGTDKTLVAMVSATSVRPSVYFLTAGCAATPADQSTKFALMRSTDNGTGSAVTPIAHDAGDPSGVLVSSCKNTITFEPTYTASNWLLLFDLNQQNTYKFETLPQYGFKLAAATNSGVGFKSLSGTGTAVHDCSLFFAE